MGGADRAQARSAEHGPGVGTFLFMLGIIAPFAICMLGCAPELRLASTDAGGMPAACVPKDNDAAVADGCGVFASASRGSEGAAGTKGAPLASLDAAVAAAVEKGTLRVYACAETFDETVVVPAGVTVYGGLDCANGWRWIGDASRTTLTSPEGEIPLRMGGGTGTARIEDLHVVARSIDPNAASTKGASSIAAMAEGIDVELVRCELEAGDGAPGADGAPYATSAMAGDTGNGGNEACSGPAVLGGLDKVNDCGTLEDTSDDSIGGSGGISQASSGGDGSDGSPLAAQNGGAGETTTACTAGSPGDGGATGTDGDGAQDLGTLSAAGYTGAAGGEGGKGGTAQGGGGGAAAKGGSGAGKCPSAASAGGASGGSGGSGGCGGAGGKGGGAGGASIALVSLDAPVHFEDVILKTGRGGAGGAGGPGQTGGGGGGGGPGGTLPAGVTTLNLGCAGGTGGTGATGGHGGGGRGGHAIGIAYRGQAPSLDGTIIQTGDPGLGGAGADAQHDGAAGVNGDIQAFLQ